jgi:hypothetical protein
MSVSSIDFRKLINGRLDGQTQIIKTTTANTLELYGIKYKHTYYDLYQLRKPFYDIKIAFFWDVKPCSLVDIYLPAIRRYLLPPFVAYKILTPVVYVTPCSLADRYQTVDGTCCVAPHCGRLRLFHTGT